MSMDEFLQKIPSGALNIKKVNKQSFYKVETAYSLTCDVKLLSDVSNLHNRS